MSHALRLAALTLTCLAALAATAQAGTLPALHAVPDRAHGGRIVDAQGRHVLLRGVNVNQLGEYWQGTAVPPTLPLTKSDPKRIAAIGWNVVRLIVSWSRVEPSPGRYDEAYLRTVAAQVRRLRDQGVYSIVDLHQDAWSATLAARPDEVCAENTKPALGWDGAPAWATLDDGGARCYLGTRELSAAVQNSWSAFFADRPAADGVGIQTRYVAMLRHLGRTFAKETAVAGIDVMNEPGAFGDEAQAALSRFYARAVTAIRQGEKDGRGLRHLILVEPSVTWSITSKGAPPPFAHDRGLVYSPHLYGGSLGTKGPPQRDSFVTARAEAATFGGAPVLTGEWGGDPTRAGAGGDGYFLAHQQLQDAFAISATLWTWKQSCGDPHDVLTQREGAASPTPPWGLYEMDCAGGGNRIVGQHEDLVTDLTRGYVRRAPGRLTKTSYAPAARTLTASGRDVRRGTGRLEVFFPGPSADARGSGLKHFRAKTLGKGVVITATATGAWTLRVRPLVPSAG